ncbi:translation initiation factor IF-2 [Candidatus Liberibacter sp.]|uniref:translation initiation factor IF-2 n=1 Tax=Candidatus Liberibacter sp. TaxID=34022 RepID=UPI0015F52059|nr:translation initiation factor IF-2 [Candidatus Liberibacter sp.]MBA5724275.1 translation initiation factor IF-2 [Candidatus Liberibacter sp.]
MTDNKDNEKSNIAGKKTLTLKTSGLSGSSVRQNQSVSQVRARSVVVETRKRRFSRQGDEKVSVVAKSSRVVENPAENSQEPSQMQIKRGLRRTSRSEKFPSQAKEGSSFGGLSPGEIESRRRALLEAQKRDSESSRIKAEKRLEEEILNIAETAGDERSDREIKEEVKKPSFEEKVDLLGSSEVSVELQSVFKSDALDTEKNSVGARSKIRKSADDSGGEHGKSRGKRGKSSQVISPKSPSRSKDGDEEKRNRKPKIATVDLDDEGGASVRGRSLSAMRRRQEKFRKSQQQEQREKISRDVVVPETITIQELSQRMSERSSDVIKFLMKEGQMMKPGDVIDADLSEIIATEFGHVVKRVLDSDVELGIFDVVENESDLQIRPPVVTVMGHVDHGKTSLLDAVRKAAVVKKEAGGITQHIGAYQVDYKGKKITFIDTPGHVVFSRMRARGAQITDVAVLVLAADERVMPQAIESISHAKSAGVSIIVALNKIDKSSSDAQKVRTELLSHDVFVESMGGDILDVEISAKKHLHLDKLLDAILLQAEILDLKVIVNRKAEGSVIEARLDRGRGPVVTVLVQKGTLRIGQILVVGDQWGRVRALFNDKGKSVTEALPSMPIEVLGLQGMPMAGDKFGVVDSESRAREISQYRKRLTRDKSMARQLGSRGSLESLVSNVYASSAIKDFPVIIKADVQGSVEAIVNALDDLKSDEVRASVMHSGAGAINETDVSLAKASNAVIFGFNVRASSQARALSEKDGIKILYYNVIYDLIDDVKGFMSGLLSPEVRETFLGNAKVLEVFTVTKLGKVAGCMISEGKVERGSGVRLIRDGIVIHEGILKTLKRFKEEVSEVHMGQECGMAFEKYDAIQVDDVVECFRVEHIKRSL